jgi:predicted N-acetyltransferase YhbS
MYEYAHPNPGDHVAIEALLDLAFGQDRHKKTSYRFREGVDPLPSLNLVARQDGRLVGTIAYWPVAIGEAAVPALLLGPVAVEPALRGLGIGVTLIRRTLAKARREGHRIAVLVGDADYYTRFGFRPAEGFGIAMPGQPDRLMVKPLVAGALEGVSGDIRAWSKGARRVMAA